ncbi:uncharacterized protein N7529_007119 [Penicillium soppii]|uniref:uncharacterized protein n=1 Tax=Penicillium soppii TaxID=69789 RepID=UPI00254840B6|nr:uncharacterized protein N7529_007119 [Penicillium soppii]KAJ5865203.1 hypothetical protein N7529_007119 [Penicillium soppii]
MGNTENPSFKSTPPSENSPRELGITALSEENICQSSQQNTSQRETIELLVAYVKELDERTKKIENGFIEYAAYNAGVQIVMEQLRDEVHGLKEREFGQSRFSPERSTETEEEESEEFLKDNIMGTSFNS